MTDLEKLRSCGRFEIFSTARHHLGFFKNVAFAATYTNPSSHTSIQDLVYHALRAVIAGHPMLSAIAVNEDKQDSEVYFARLPLVNLNTCVEFIERKQFPEGYDKDDQLEQVLQDQHKRPFKEALGARPFWRLAVLHSPSDTSTFTAVWVFHHALGDGTCGPVFHRSLLSALQTAPTPEAVNPIVASPSTSLLPPFEALHPHPVSWPFFLRAILASVFPSYFAPRAPKLWTGPPVTAPDPLPNTKVHMLILPASTTKTLLALSRENKTTLTATIQTAVASALLSTLEAEQYDKVLASGPISVRSLLKHEGKPIRDDEFVLALTQYEYMHARATHASTTFPWDEARAVRAAIQAELAKNGRDNTISLLRYVSDMHEYFMEKVGQERQVSFEVSNLGAVKVDDDREGKGGWELGRCVFSQTANVTGQPIVCSVVTGGDGCCVMAFSWLGGVVEEEMVRAVAQGVEVRLRGLVAGSSQKCGS